jgi:hypothetical protein
MILGDVMYGDSGLLRIYGLSIDDLTEGGFGILGRNLTAKPASNGARFRTEAAPSGRVLILSRHQRTADTTSHPDV